MGTDAEVSACVPDWSRERRAFLAWSPAKSLLSAIRAHQAAKRSPWRRLVRAWAVLRHRFWSAISGADIPLRTRIGGGLILTHPNGIVIHGDATIGVNCLICQQVTLGQLAAGRPPIIGGHVDIGAGAVVLGPVVIGNHAKIGANAVVLRDVPARATAVGVPARIIPEAARRSA